VIGVKDRLQCDSRDRGKAVHWRSHVPDLNKGDGMGDKGKDGEKRLAKLEKTIQGMDARLAKLEKSAKRAKRSRDEAALELAARAETASEAEAGA
jgi:hypothetical protein